MTAVNPPRPLAEADDREAFGCGRDALNSWFRRHAWSNHSAGMSRVSILTERGNDAIVGYVTLSSAHIERAFLPKPQQRNRPDPIPVTLLGQLAVHQAHHGQGHATSLLLFALRTALRASESVASAGVLTHPLDDNVRGFYARWGFEELPHDPRRAMMVRMVDLQTSLSTI